MTDTSKKQKRSAIPIASKGQVVAEWERTKADHGVLAAKFGIKHRSSVSRIIKDAEKWKALAAKLGDGEKIRASATEHPQLDKCLIHWIDKTLSFKNAHFALSGRLIQEKALSFAKELGISEDDFKASEGWLSKFKTRHNLAARAFEGEAGSAPVSELFGERQKLQDVLEAYEPRNVFNADETGSYIKMPPRKGLLKAKTSGSKKELTRWTTLHCVNADGSELLKVFVIGKAQKPRPFKKDSNLRNHHHVSYIGNANGWMNSEAWTDWMKELDARMRAEKRMILLLVDNFSGHKTTDGWEPSNVRVYYLPPNTTAHLQPLDAGIISAFKRKYTAQLSKHWVGALDKLLASPNPSTDGKAIKMVQLVNAQMVFAWIHTAWNGITAETVRNCWLHTGITPASWATAGTVSSAPTETEAAKDEERREVAQILAMLQHEHVISECGDSGFTVDQYLNMGAEVQQMEMETDAEIVARITKGTEEAEEVEEDGEVVEAVKLIKIPTDLEIIEGLEKLKLWATYKGGEVGASASKTLQALEREARRLDATGRKQTTITNFFPQKASSSSTSASTSTSFSSASAPSGSSRAQPIVFNDDDHAEPIVIDDNDEDPEVPSRDE